MTVVSYTHKYSCTHSYSSTHLRQVPRVAIHYNFHDICFFSESIYYEEINKFH